MEYGRGEGRAEIRSVQQLLESQDRRRVERLLHQTDGIQGRVRLALSRERGRLFFMMKGRLAIKLRDGEVRIRPGEFVVIPRRVDYLPMA
jgi:mannose-6-phosphate isomerase-like protein (cupin superfamily)